MTLPAWLTVKPLLWVIVALLAIVGVQFVQLQLAAADVATAEAASATATSALGERTTERDAWKARAADLASAETGWKEAVATLQKTLDRAQQENRRLEAQGQAAIRAAQAAATDADRTLKKFVAQFATESRRPGCAAALAQMEAACPALSDY